MPRLSSLRTFDGVDELIARQKPGYSLEQALYVEPEIFDEEFKHIFSRQWPFTDHIGRIPTGGDYFLFKIAGEEIIVVRGAGDTVYAHRNVCRDRGSRVCLEPEGHVRRLVCPYHAWTYGLDGSLESARMMGNDFDKSQHGLRSCQVRVFEGLIFVNLTPEGEGRVPDFDYFAKDLLPMIEQADLRRTKIAHVKHYPTPANWKLVFENYYECYHCPAAHPEFCRVQLHSLRDGHGSPEAIGKWEMFNKEWQKRAEALGHRYGITYGSVGRPEKENYYTQAYGTERMGTNYDYEEAYASLAPSSKFRLKDLPLLGRYKEDDGGQADWGLAYTGYAYTNCRVSTHIRMIPLGPLETDMTVTWLVHEDAEEGKHYDIESLIALIDITITQDTKIVTDNQAGVLSRSYRPGPYNPKLEGGIITALDDYLRLLKYGRSLEDQKGEAA